MLAALDDLEAACASGEFRPSVEDEDVHTALERGLLERLGALGGKLRAGRSRNDQVATDLRLYLRDRARGVAARLVELADALTEQAQRHVETPAPGMTHLQHAQPVSFGHWLLAHVQALSGAEPERIDEFIRYGMWLNVAAAMGVEDLSMACDWVQRELSQPTAE